MSKTTIKVIARVIALPDKVAAVKLVLISIVEPTRQEAGCIIYELFQNNADLTDFTFVEEWKSQALLNTHLASVHITQAVSQLQGLIATAPEIRIYQQLA